MVSITTLNCLLIRQPYASLIAFGRKRWEFRSYYVQKRGTIGIAASPNPPYSTKSIPMNSASLDFPRGYLLATAELVNCIFVTASDLRRAMTAPIELELHGHKVTTLDSPVGEPEEDVRSAANSPSWESYAWEFENVHPLDSQILVTSRTRSTWTSVNYPG